MIKNYGTCVAVRHRKDGTARFRFEVRRNCPQGWKPTIPILVDGRDSVILDQMTVAQEKDVERRADNLFRQLESMRAGERAPGTIAPVIERSWEKLIQLRRQHSSWLERKPATKTTYMSTQKKILKIFGGDPELAPSIVLESQIDVLVRAHAQSAYRRKALYQEIRVLLKKAMREGWRELAKDVVYSAPLPTARIRTFTPHDLRCAVTAAIQTDERGLARLMLAQYEIGQRLQSVRIFRYGVHYKDGVFIYRCVKGERPIRIEILNQQTRSVLDAHYREGAWMFPKGDTGKPFTGPELSRAYARLRKSIPGFDQKLPLRALRHTVICELALADCNVLEIATVTGHNLDTVHRTIMHYFKVDTELARRAMEKRERRRLEGVGGLTGSIIMAGTRRIFIGDQPEAQVPTPLGIEHHAA